MRKRGAGTYSSNKYSFSNSKYVINKFRTIERYIDRKVAMYISFAAHYLIKIHT